MPYTSPQATSYPGVPVYRPTQIMYQPPEGNQYLTFYIDWSIMGGSDSCVAIDCRTNTPNQISKISAINIDNSKCGSDVVFIFDDTQSTLTVPAYESGIFAILTNSLAFKVLAAQPVTYSPDSTSFQVLNFVPPPQSLQPASQSFTLLSSIYNNALQADLSTLWQPYPLPNNPYVGQLIGSSTNKVSGTLLSLNIAITGAGANHATGSGSGQYASNIITIVDTAKPYPAPPFGQPQPRLLWATDLYTISSSSELNIEFHAIPQQVRFNTGVWWLMSQNQAGGIPFDRGQCYFNLEYRSP